MEWIDAKRQLPTESGDILFIARDELTDERIGITVTDAQIVLLRHTDFNFSELLYWIPIPRDPRGSNGP